MEAPETFHQYTLTIDPQTKAILTSDSSITAEIEELNKFHRTLIASEAANQTCPPPVPVHPKRTVQITKLRESGNAAFKKAQYTEAIKLYDLAIRMATDRPSWEPSQLVRDELSTLYNNRAQALMSLQNWSGAAVDAETSVEMKRVGNPKAYWRRGQCLKEMGRLNEAEEWARNGLELERMGPERSALSELEGLLRDIAKDLGGS